MAYSPGEVEFQLWVFRTVADAKLKLGLTSFEIAQILLNKVQSELFACRAWADGIYGEPGRTMRK